MEYLFLAYSALASALLNLIAPLRSRRGNSIVVFKLDHIGDLATAGPALRALRARRPEAHITLVVGGWCEELARTAFDVDRVAVYDSPSYDRSGGARRGNALRSLTAALGDGRFDTAYGLRDDPASVLFCLRGGARRRRDRGTVRFVDRATRFFRRLGGADAGPLHEIDTNLHTVGARRGREDFPGAFLRISPPAAERVRSRILEGLAGERPLVVVHPGAGEARRCWPLSAYRELIARLAAGTGVAVAVTGSADERGMAEEAAGDAPSVRVLAGDLSLAEMAALLAAADAFVGVDTGMMHVSVGVGTPVVALFGPEDPLRFGPTGPHDVVVTAGLDCAPCHHADCPRDTACISEIEVDDVLAAVVRVLEQVRGGSQKTRDEEAA